MRYVGELCRRREAHFRFVAHKTAAGKSLVYQSPPTLTIHSHFEEAVVPTIASLDDVRERQEAQKRRYWRHVVFGRTTRAESKWGKKHREDLFSNR